MVGKLAKTDYILYRIICDSMLHEQQQNLSQSEQYLRQKSVNLKGLPERFVELWSTTTTTHTSGSP